MPLFQTKRLTIREANREDVSFFYDLLNSRNWIEFIGNRGIDSKAKSLDYIEKSLIHSYKKNGFGLYVMEESEFNTAIGICGFVQRDYLAHPDIGFAILPAYEGKGYTTEAGIATMTYGKEILNLHPIFGITSHDNEASKKVLEKIGLHPSKTITTPDGKEELLLYTNE